jgi:FkbM family methyltransferase
LRLPRAAERWLGLLRSIALYRRPGRQRGLKRLYGTFVRPGDLVFDVGAHVGDRTAAFAALGARVIALEPQPVVLAMLRRLVGNNPRVTIRAEAVGRQAGTAKLAVSRRNPTVSTLAEDWRTHIVEHNPTFAEVRWQETVDVPVTTLDALIAEHGVPAFCKIDVEGFEAEVLAGLSRPIPSCSVEFVAGAVGVASDCVRRLSQLGVYEFNAIAGEERDFLNERWLTAEEMLAWLSGGAGGVSSGDVYARHLANRG